MVVQSIYSIYRGAGQKENGAITNASATLSTQTTPWINPYTAVEPGEEKCSW